MTTGPYDAAFYERMSESASRSAAVVIPLVLELIQPQSVIDIGCGTGTWLRAFRDRGVPIILGLDGSLAAGSDLEIERGAFRVMDVSQAVDVGRRYDLAVCLEVAEHLTPEQGDTLIDSLTRIAPVVLFSAAIPGQGGTGHINEQWPSHWAAAFGRRGYVAIDGIRRRIWTHPEVAFWYAQNLLIFAGVEALERWPELARERASTAEAALDLVHPERYLEWVEWGTVTVYETLGGAP